MIVGITGGIATGKSTVSRQFQTAGWRVIDADQVAKHVRDTSPVVKDALIKRLGPGLYASGRLDTRRLGQLVFADAAALHELNQLLQPLIRAEIIRQLHSIDSNKLVLDIPLLFEQGYQQLCDVIVVVAVDEDTQYRRLVARDSLSEREAHQRISAQMPLAEKVVRADWTIDNSCGRRQTARQAAWLMDFLEDKLSKEKCL
ncbi:dephospho-CoA kinase [uncultured Limosilactobacillus sp.]|uniref:dephospho-CoA kinase n=1 Tax=uncultured Limosilactobacillus sp. TaxID=2837629 RepID=UPI002600AD4D|nr:dephospho-CoA kinase [uncultured Limosilactobacillus sp.]